MILSKFVIMSCIFQYGILNALGDYPREEILQTMFQCHGNREAAEKLLVESTLQPFLDNIWAEKDTDARNRFALDLGGPLPEMCHSFSTSIIFHGDFQKMVMDKNVNKDVSYGTEIIDDNFLH